MRQTAVEWLMENSHIIPKNELNKRELIKQAKEKFYRQITNAYESGVFDGFNNQPLDYYNETYREQEKDIEF